MAYTKSRLAFGRVVLNLPFVVRFSLCERKRTTAKMKKHVVATAANHISAATS
jgi:hypothetical protein